MKTCGRSTMSAVGLLRTFGRSLQPPVMPLWLRKKSKIVPLNWLRGIRQNSAMCKGRFEHWNSLQGVIDAKRRDMILSEISQRRQKEEILWHQCSRVDFLCHRDSNSKWFHTRASARRTSNHITSLLDERGQEKTELRDIKNIITRFFQDLFITSHPWVLIEFYNTCSHESLQVRVTSADEVKKAVFQMHPIKAPDSDGLNPFFYQYYWDIAGDHVTKAVMDILNMLPSHLLLIRPMLRLSQRSRA